MAKVKRPAAAIKHIGCLCCILWDADALKHFEAGKTCNIVQGLIMTNQHLFASQKNGSTAGTLALLTLDLCCLIKAQMMQMMQTFLQEGSETMFREQVTSDFVTGTVLEWTRPY